MPGPQKRIRQQEGIVIEVSAPFDSQCRGL